MIRKPLSNTTFSLAVLFFVAFLTTVSYAAEEEKTEISSDTLEYKRDSGAFYLKGNVEIRKGDILLKADESYFDEQTSDALLEGEVTYEDSDIRIQSDSAEVNIDSRTGRLHNGYVFIKKDNFHINADEIEKKGEDHYLLKNARLTTCDAPVPPWCFRTSRADVIVGDRVKATDAVFEIKGLPVLYTPYLWAPVLIERKTGLLLPEAGYDSKLGVFYKQPFFIVLSDNRDATVRLDYYSFRGFGEGLEYRYIERNGMSGNWWGYHVRDDKLDTNYFLLKAQHEQRRRAGISHFIGLDLLNEDDFYQEYSSEFDTRTQRFLQSSGSVYYSSRLLRYYISGRYWQDLQFDDDDISQDLPTVGISLHPAGLGPLLFSLNTEATHFPSADTYQVSRYSVTPGLALGLGNAVRLNQALKYHGAVYDISGTDMYPSSMERGTASYDIGIVTSIFKRYSTFTHTIDPELSYTYVSVSDDNVPLLDAQEAIRDLSDIGLSVRSDLISDKKMFFSLLLSQPYDLDDNDQPWKDFEGELSLNHKQYSLWIESFYDHYLNEVRILNGSAGLNFSSIRISAGHRYDRDSDISFYTGGLGFSIAKSLYFDNAIQYDAEREDQNVRSFRSSVIYSAQCWGLTLTYVQEPDDFRMTINFVLKGIGEYGAQVI